MSSTIDNWFPFHVGPYLKDTGRLTTEQHGAYLLLIIDLWCKGPIPDDDQQLASVARLPLPKWRQARKVLMQFFLIEDGAWRNKRVDQELQVATDISSKRSEAGRKGAERRWQKDGKPDGNCHPADSPKGMAKASRADGQTNAQIQIHLQKEEAAADASLIARATAATAIAAAAAEIVDLFDDVRARVFGVPCRVPHANDLLHAEQFLVAGATLGTCRAVFEAVMQRQKAKGRVRPDQLAYMAGPVAEMLSARQQGMAMGHAAGLANASKVALTEQQSVAARQLREEWQVDFLKKGRSLGCNGTDHEVRDYVARGLVTADEAQRAGYAA